MQGIIIVAFSCSCACHFNLSCRPRKEHKFRLPVGAAQFREFHYGICLGPHAHQALGSAIKVVDDIGSAIHKAGDRVAPHFHRQFPPLSALHGYMGTGKFAPASILEGEENQIVL